MNQKVARSKMCLLDIEVNRLSKVLFGLMICLAGSITVLNGIHGDYILFFVRCVLLLSSIIPISLRVNLDLAKLYYSFSINTDDEIKGSMARNSNIPSMDSSSKTSTNQASCYQESRVTPTASSSARCCWN